MQKYPPTKQACWLDREPKGIQNRSLMHESELGHSRWNQKPLEWSKQVEEKPPGATWLRRG